MLNPDLHSPQIQNLRSELEKRIVGQEKAITAILNTYETYLAGLNYPGQPIGNFLFLGPTGTGKTRTVEALAEVLAGSPMAVLKINCGEYQHSHDIAKLVGSPPGYLGHRETTAALSQSRLSFYTSEKMPVSFLLFDEIEKASDALWKILLGILDKAELTLGDNQRTDFSKTMIFMTSNLGAGKMQEFLGPNLGFYSPKGSNEKLASVGLEAARRKFSPEFFNRLDRENIVTYLPFTKAQMYAILNLELGKLQVQLDARALLNRVPSVLLVYTPEAKDILLEKGFDPRYGARPLVQTVRTQVGRPLAALIGSNQLRNVGEVVVDAGENGLTFNSFDTVLKAA